MELSDYFRILKKRGWIIIVVALIAGASAYGFSKMQTPVYSASTRLNVQPARADWGLSSTLKDLLRNYVENIRTHKTALTVIDRGQLDMSSQDLLGKLFVEPDSSTFTIKVEARDTDPEVAYAIVDMVATVFIEERDAWNQRQDKRDRVEVNLLDSVYSLGYQQYKPNTQVNTLAGLLFGVMMGVLVVFFLEWLAQDIIRSGEDVERALGVTVLGQIPTHTGQNAAETLSTGQAKLKPQADGLGG